jgi:hypothetical protein
VGLCGPLPVCDRERARRLLRREARLPVGVSVCAGVPVCACLCLRAGVPVCRCAGVPVTMAGRKLTAAQRGAIRQAFDLVDTEGGGSLPLSEVRVALRSLGLSLSLDEVAAAAAEAAAAAGTGAGASAPKERLSFAAFLVVAADLLVRWCACAVPVPVPVCVCVPVPVP